MRILIVLEYFEDSTTPKGGAARQLTRLAGKLIQKGLDVTIVTGQWKPGERRKAVINRITVHRLFTFWGMFNVKGLRRFGYYTYLISLFVYLLMHRDDYDLIHCFSATSSVFAAALAGKLLDKRTLARPMASGARWGDISRMSSGQVVPGGQWMLGSLRDIDRIIALNQEIVGELEALGVEAHKIVRIPNGVETNGIMRKADYEIKSELVVTFVGRLHPQKGVDVLLQALGKVAVDLPQLKWRLQLVGEGPLRNCLEAQTQDMGIHHRVDFLGQVKDVFPILYESDIFVLPSRSEGMSNALIEAMACGSPCVVTDIPANAEIVEDRKNGLVVNVDDDEDIARAIVYLAEHENLRERLGREAANTIDSHYSLDSVVDQYLSVYQNLLQ